MFKWLKDMRGLRATENAIVDMVIKSMNEEPENWDISRYTAGYGSFVIWIANSPYSDMTLNGRKLPRRGELRKALAECAMNKSKKAHCMNCNSLQKEKDIDYLGDSEWQCPNCKTQ